MNENELRRTVFLIVWCLLFSDLFQVPNIDATVTGGGGEDCWVMWRPCQLEDFASVPLESVPLVQFTDVEESNCLVLPASQHIVRRGRRVQRKTCLVCATGDDEVSVCRTERDSHDFLLVGFVRFYRPLLSSIPARFIYQLPVQYTLRSSLTSSEFCRH